MTCDVAIFPTHPHSYSLTTHSPSHSPSHPPTYPPNYSLTNLLTHHLTHSLNLLSPTQPSTHLPTHPPNHSPTLLSTCQLIHHSPTQDNSCLHVITNSSTCISYSKDLSTHCTAPLQFWVIVLWETMCDVPSFCLLYGAMELTHSLAPPCA